MHFYSHNNKLLNINISWKSCLTHLFVLAPLDAFLFPISWVGKLHPHQYPGHMNKTESRSFPDHCCFKLVSRRVCVCLLLWTYQLCNDNTISRSEALSSLCVRFTIIVSLHPKLWLDKNQKIQNSLICVYISVVTVKSSIIKVWWLLTLNWLIISFKLSASSRLVCKVYNLQAWSAQETQAKPPWSCLRWDLLL